MEKIMQVTITLPTGKVVATKEILLENFTRKDVAELGERCDYGSMNEERIEFVLSLPAGNHRSVEQVNENLIVRYMDHYPQYYYKK
jgi:hypothetical protein